jgi:hypothetical protein
MVLCFQKIRLLTSAATNARFMGESSWNQRTQTQVSPVEAEKASEFIGVHPWLKNPPRRPPHSMPSSSTSNTSVLPGGILGLGLFSP